MTSIGTPFKPMKKVEGTTTTGSSNSVKENKTAWQGIDKKNKKKKLFPNICLKRKFQHYVIQKFFNCSI